MSDLRLLLQHLSETRGKIEPRAAGRVALPAPKDWAISMRMNAFFTSMFEEIGARRRRLRASFGDRGQTLTEFLLFAGLFIGSLGLYVRVWMPAAAPWGFAIPFLFLAGYLFIEMRRQSALKAGVEPEKIATTFDWSALLWSMFCALAGAAAFVIAWSAKPPPPPEPETWTPPESAVTVDIVP